MKFLVFIVAVLLFPAIAGAQLVCTQADLTHPNSASLSWADNSTDETGFVIERKLNTGAYATLTTVATNTVSALDTTVVRSNTVANTYTYRLKAVKTGAADSTYSNEACVTFAPNPPAVPNAPSGFSVSQNNASPSNTLSMTWDDTTTEATFEVFGRPAQGNRTFVKLASLVQDTTSYDWTGLARHKSYCGRVRGVNAKGAGPYSPIACNTTSW